MRYIERVTKKGHRYRIEYWFVTPGEWNWQLLLYSPNDESDWVGVDHGCEYAIFPRKAMEAVLNRHIYFKNKH